MKKVKRKLTLVIVLLLFVSVKSDADEKLSVHDEEGAVKGSDSSEVTAKEQGTKSDDSDCPCVSSDNKNENSKLEKPDKVSSNGGDESQISNAEDSKVSQQVVDSKQTVNENTNECNQQSGSQAAKRDEVKVEDSDNTPVAVNEKKSKDDDKNQKINLNDVNSQVEDNDPAKSKKRETYSDSPSYVLGLPRDASYFFDDLEPFINNNTDIGRIGRAVPSRQIQVNILADNGVTNFYIFYLDKHQKSTLNGKGHEIMEDDVDEDEEEEKNEDEKQDEDDYDDDEDADSDCKPTTSCPTTPKCPTTTKCPTTPKCTTTTPCPPPTTKCTTKHQCPTTCKTSPQCTTTKCPRVCGKGADLVKDMEKESDTSCDSNKKKHRHSKRRFHNKE